MVDAEILNKIKKFSALVKSKYDCRDIILFGSYVKGSNREESDIDIAVILNDFDNYLTMQLELMRLRRKIDSRIEPHPFRIADFNRTNPLANEIIEHGQRIEN